MQDKIETLIERYGMRITIINRSLECNSESKHHWEKMIICAKGGALSMAIDGRDGCISTDNRLQAKKKVLVQAKSDFESLLKHATK